MTQPNLPIVARAVPILHSPEWFAMATTFDNQDRGELIAIFLDETLTSARSLYRMAGVIASFDRRAMEIPAEFPPTLVYLLRQIANGRLTAEIVARCYKPSLLDRIAHFSLEAQKKLSSDDKVELVGPSGTRMKSIFDLTKREADQVFSGAHIRTVQEQIIYRRDHERPTAATPTSLGYRTTAKKFCVDKPTEFAWTELVKLMPANILKLAARRLRAEQT